MNVYRLLILRKNNESKKLVERLEREQCILVTKLLNGRGKYTSDELRTKFFKLELKYLPSYVIAANIFGNFFGIEKLGRDVYHSYVKKYY